MRRLNRIWKLYLVYTVPLMGVLTVGGFLLQDKLERRLVVQCAENGFAMAHLVAEALACRDLSRKNIQPFCERFGNAADIRVSILNGRGEVEGDSSGKVSIGESRARRPEVDSAISEGWGHAVRRSVTVGIEMCYVALRAEGSEKIVRIGIPLENATRLKNEVAVLFALVLYLAPVLIIGAVFFVARRLASAPGRG
jgi:two-component system, OmpR family, phosphate regulon sensor histidine kinase PhoR